MSRYRITDDEIRAERRMRGEPVDHGGDGKGLVRYMIGSLLIVVVCAVLVWGW